MDIHEAKLARDLIRRNDAGIYEHRGVKPVKYDGDFLSLCLSVAAGDHHFGGFPGVLERVSSDSTSPKVC